MAAANRVAADNPLHEGDQTAAPADGGLFPRVAHPYPCGGCAAFHDDESGFCAQCSRRLVPPHTVAMLARAQRRVYLALLTLIMSMFETSDKVIIATFTASTTLVVLLWFWTKAVASRDPGPWIAGLVLVVVAAVCCGPAVRRMIRSIEAVDAISGEFAAASTKLLADRDESQRGPASFKPSDPPRQPGRELRDIYVKARERRDLFAVEILEAVARAGKAATEPSRAIRGPSIKHLSRAREKIVLDYGGDAHRLRDLLRGSVVCATVDELDVVVDALRAKGVEVIRIKNRFRDKPTPSGYRDVNINLVYHGLVVELQLHLAEVLQVADKQHVAYEAARELDLMGVLEKPDAASLSETAPIEMKVAYNLARFVPALLSLFIAILYLDAFTFKGLRLIVRRADPATWRGFEQPYIPHRIYGIALAAPYLANVYMLARAAGLFGEAAKDARRGRTRVGLLYEKYFGYEGSHFVWKVFCFQIVEVFLQATGKIPLFLSYTDVELEEGDGATFWFVYVFILALLVNVLYPTLLLRSRLVSQAMLIPHEPVAYVSNLIPLMHAHFVIATLERAGAEARALQRVAPVAAADEVVAPGAAVADNEAPKRAVPGDAAPEETAGIDAPAPDAGALPDDSSAEPSKPVPLGATPAGHRYRGLVCLSLFFWTVAMGFFYTRGSPTFWFVSDVLEIKSSCTWKVRKRINTWQERACDRPCEEIPGCGDGWCDVYEGECVKSTSDDRCVGKADRFELGHDEWCEAGLRVYECEDEDDEDDEDEDEDEDEDSFSYFYSYADEDEDRCSREWPESPGDHPYEVFADSGKCRSQDSAEPDRAHDEDVGTVADIAECWRRCQGLNEDGKTSYCASMHQSTMECSCQGADSYGDFYEFDCLVDVGEYTLAVHQDWRGSRCHSDGRHVCGCDDGDYCLPYDACCVEHEFDATGQKVSTTCHWDRGQAYDGGVSPWEPETSWRYCTAGHSDAGAVAPAYHDCSQAAIDAGRCGTGDWDTCAECVDDNIPTGTFFANVGYTSCPNWVVDAIGENAADGGTCSDAWTKRTELSRKTRQKACSFQLWEDSTESEPWFTKLGVFALFSLVCLPSTISFMELSTFTERPNWRRRGSMLLCFSGFYLGPYTLILFLVVLGYNMAVITEERVKLGAFFSVVIFLTVHWKAAIGLVVLGCAAVAFAPRHGERKKVRSAVFTTKASAAADRGRLPRWACYVYFCATVTFIALAAIGVSTDPSSCPPCNCKENTLIDCYADARTLELRFSSWNGIDSYLPEQFLLENKGIKAIKSGAFGDMVRLERLELRRNRISTIEPYTFVGLGRLEELALLINEIHIVKSNAFLGLHRLRELNLKFNEIQTLEADAFRGLHNLEILQLKKNNINRIENGAFAGLDSLKEVDLRGNPVTCADAHAAGLPQSVECEGF